MQYSEPFEMGCASCGAQNTVKEEPQHCWCCGDFLIYNQSWIPDDIHLIDDSEETVK